MSITIEEVRHVAKLARLDLAEAELMSLQGELNVLLGHFGDLQNIDTDGIEPRSHAVALQEGWAGDAPQPPFLREIVLANAPSSKAGLFLVPTIIES